MMKALRIAGLGIFSLGAGVLFLSCALYWQRYGHLPVLRMPPRLIVPARVPHGIEFDANFEAELARSQSAPVFIRQRWEAMRQYADTLSQPVFIQSWQGNTAKCELYFATNRGVASATAGSDREQFGNEVVERYPHFGRALLSMPSRSRGADPLLGDSGNNETQANDVVTFEEVRRLGVDDALLGILDQIARSRQQDVLLFVHGFNVDFDSALARTAQLALDIPFNGAVVSYCWPSQGGVRNYGLDESINATSVEPFTQFLSRLIASVPADARINIVVHSMGNRIVLKAIQRLPLAVKKPLASLVLCAPDVGAADFRQWAPAVVARCEQVTLYASRSDSALIISKHLHGEQRAGDAHPPICLAGIDTIDASSVDFDLVLGHSYYGSNRNLLTELYFVLKEQRPTSQRKYLSRMPTGDLSAWEFCAEAPYIRCSWRVDEPALR